MQLKVYVISVKSFTDRHAHVEQQAKKFGFSFEYIWDHDANEIAEVEDLPVDPKLSLNSISNVLKHFEAQKRFLSSNADIALILEDDVILFEGFARELEQIVEHVQNFRPGWLVFLGGADNKRDKRFFRSRNQEIIESPITTAEAYLVDRHGCKARLGWLSKNIITRQADHQIKLIDEELGLVHYCLSVPLATQGSITGKFKTTLDASRSRHSSIFLKLKYEVKRFRRHTILRLWYRFFS